jgi:sRNA-binding regulator protein Hfq
MNDPMTTQPKVKPSAAPAPEKKKEPKPDQPKRDTPRQYFGLQSGDFLMSLADKMVKVTTLDGKVYVAVLIGVDQFNILLRLGDGSPVLMPKHAIKLLHAAPPDKPVNE